MRNDSSLLIGSAFTFTVGTLMKVGAGSLEEDELAMSDAPEAAKRDLPRLGDRIAGALVENLVISSSCASFSMALCAGKRGHQLLVRQSASRALTCPPQPTETIAVI